ncbi:MAG: transporter related protein [Ilumatobacteraceae bacterium]|nr:transporter related protein [Ilumatobacteraceae bacterium]
MNTTIEIQNLSKHYGDITAVDDLSFGVISGRVTGFLGRNGSGKTTTMRMMLGLAAPSSGRATFGGRTYSELGDPIREVGAAIDSAVFHPSRTAREHLDVMSIAAGIRRSRADEVLSTVGLSEAGDRRVGGFSMGMRQRLGLACALLGDPPVLLLDEPLNGLDPDGIAWVRVTLRRLAAEGRTVLLSSHLLAEVATTVDDVVVIERGRLMAAMPLAELAGNHKTVVRTPQAAALTTALLAAGHIATRTADDEVTVADVTADVVGLIAAQQGVTVLGLAEQRDDLEQIFHQLTRNQEAMA